MRKKKITKIIEVEPYVLSEMLTPVFFGDSSKYHYTLYRGEMACYEETEDGTVLYIKRKDVE